MNALFPSETLTLQSPDNAYTRDAWFHPGPQTSHRLAILLDGEFYLERAQVLPIIQALTKAGKIPAMSWLFVASGGAAARHTDFTFNPDFARFIGQSAVGWAHERLGGVQTTQNLICGLSLSGLATAHIALLYPEAFCAALCQSGSFWWKPQRLAALAAERPPQNTRFWLSVGDQETDTDVSHPPTGLHQAISQIEGVQKACAALQPHAAAVQYNLYAGGHEFAPWTAEFEDALEWLLECQS